MKREYIDGMPACDVCRERPRSRYREIAGWEELRHGGGANRIAARRETGRWACETCMAEMIHEHRQHADPNQGAMSFGTSDG